MVDTWEMSDFTIEETNLAYSQRCPLGQQLSDTFTFADW